MAPPLVFSQPIPRDGRNPCLPPALPLLTAFIGEQIRIPSCQAQSQVSWGLDLHNKLQVVSIMEIIILQSSRKCPAAAYILLDSVFLSLLDLFVSGGERREGETVTVTVTCMIIPHHLPDLRVLQPSPDYESYNSAGLA